MTLPAFLAAFAASCHEVHAQLLQHSQGIYPRGDLIRVQVRCRGWPPVPPVLDPIGVVGYARSGVIRPVQDAQAIGASLGLEASVIRRIILASDHLKAYPDTRADLLVIVGRLSPVE